MPAVAQPWPESLKDAQAIGVIERAIERQKLSHSLILQGDDLSTLIGAAHAIADRLLNPPAAAHRWPVKEHPDYLALRPKGKTRIIPIGKHGAPDPGTMREFLPKLYLTPTVAPQKVAIVYEADRMNEESSNAFLKTLEEPPGHTTILLVTTRPYSLLPTIRSRCLNFRLPSGLQKYSPEGWPAWMADYRAWLERLTEGVAGKKAAADAIMGAYGLVARFAAILEAAAAAEWKIQKAKLPDEIDEDEEEAVEIGIAHGFRSQLLIEIERATRDFSVARMAPAGADATADDGEQTRRAFTAAIDKLEHNGRLLRLNLNVAAALEDFLLTSLRLWTKR
jgi:DNA polymerase-3 subunit delta'